jgi:REP element-mobilizing transposase RayT
LPHAYASALSGEGEGRCRASCAKQRSACRKTDARHLWNVENADVRYLLSGEISKRLGLLFSSYTKAINKRYYRHGSLFQQRAKAKIVSDERYLLTLISYIHQNPVRAGHVRRPEDWPFSSYLDLIEERNGTLPEREYLRQYFKTPLEFKEFSKIVVLEVGHLQASKGAVI